MFASARIPTIALTVLVEFAFTTVPAIAQAPDDQVHGLPLTPPPVESSTLNDAPAPFAQGPDDQIHGLPLAPPPVESSTPNNEPAPTAQPSASIGFGLSAALFGPLGLALGGVAAAAATSEYVPPSHPLAPPVGQGPIP